MSQIKKQNLAFVDIETTGLSVFKHEIIEIGCVLVDSSLEIIEEFEIKIKPEHIKDADKLALKINHYKEKDWEGALTLAEAMRFFSDKTKDTIMIGHNIPFDAFFLDKAFFETGVEKKLFHYYMFDTVSIAFAKLQGEKDISKFTLHELCEFFDIKNQEEHTALSDARATFELYKKLMTL